MHYHILNTDPRGDRVTVAFHVAVPNINNDVGYNYRTAYVEFKQAEVIESGEPLVWSRIPGLDTAAHGLESGAVIERVRTVGPFSAALTPAEKLTKVEEFYTNNNAALLQHFQDILRFWGKTGDVT